MGSVMPNTVPVKWEFPESLLLALSTSTYFHNIRKEDAWRIEQKLVLVAVNLNETTKLFHNTIKFPVNNLMYIFTNAVVSSVISTEML